MTTPPARTVLLARAKAARTLVRDGVLQPPDALYLTVWPTREILDAEAQVPAATLWFRASMTERANP